MGGVGCSKIWEVFLLLLVWFSLNTDILTHSEGHHGENVVTLRHLEIEQVLYAASS